MTSDDTRNSHIRYWVIAVLFIISSINYASRATLGIAGKPLSVEYHLDPVQLGYLFSAFGWAYAIAQIPGGALVDAWSDGRMKEVGRLMNEGLKSTPGAMKLLIDDRNGRWVTRISAMLAQHHTYFITVGAGHIAGPRGLPALLAARGLHVEQIAR